MKAYTMYVKSHCEAPDWELDIVTETREEAIAYFVELLKGQCDKTFIEQHTDEGWEVRQV